MAVYSQLNILIKAENFMAIAYYHKKLGVMEL